MNEKNNSGMEVFEGPEVHPEHESWIQISTRNNLIGLATLAVLILLMMTVINLHFNRASFAALGCLIGLFVCVVVWRTSPRRHRGVVGNAELTMRINLNLNTELGLTTVNVDSHNGVVTLRGFVAHSDFIEQAERIARRCGAKQLINELTIVSTQSTPPDSYFTGMPGVTTPEGAPEVDTKPPLEQVVREAMEDDPRVNSYLLSVSVEEGIATLTGRQDTVQASDAATAATTKAMSRSKRR